MNNLSIEKKETILFFSIDTQINAKLFTEISNNLKDIIFLNVFSQQDAFNSLLNNEIDILILDEEAVNFEVINFLTQIKCIDYEPSVIYTTGGANIYTLIDVFNIGVKKVVIKDENLQLSIISEIKRLIRIRKNIYLSNNIIAKLTEANSILEEKNRRLDEFTATLAHDIRGPLGGIGMKIEYLLDAYQEDFDKKCVDILNRALSTSYRITDLVKAMYDYAKLGIKATKMFEVDLKSLVNEVVSDLSFEDSLDIRIEITDLPTVWGNPELLRRVFLNLISNAVKYNDKKEIIISIILEGLIDKTLGKFCKISVTDNGKGIDLKDDKNVFNFFQRGKGSDKNSEGLGVGLAVVQRIIELHYGRIYVQSIVNEGSKFTIEIPVDKIMIE